VKLALAQRLPEDYSRQQLMALFTELETQINLLAEGRLQGRHYTATAAPTAGSFARGDIVWNSAPTAGGTLCWVCVTAGSPGTFKTVAIQP
jgi:hypothetical protein